MHNMSISDLPMKNSVYEKVWFTSDGLSKMLFHFIAFFIFSKFQMTNVKTLMEKPSSFIMDFNGSNKVLLRTSSTLFFLNVNERNIRTSLLMIHLKCAAVHYANLNSSSINKPYLRAVEYAISFFSISYLRLF